MMKVNLQQLSKFLVEAKKNTYAGEGKEIVPWTSGFKELEYPENGWGDQATDFYYRDSYSGFYLAPGREVVYLKRMPIWEMNYHGGMEPTYQGNKDFTSQTFIFLKKALSKIEKVKPFRGPDYLKDGDYEYLNEVEGDLTRFRGKERILYKEEQVFSQDYGGCLIIQK